MQIDVAAILEQMSLSELEQDSAALLEMLEQIDRLAGLIASISAACGDLCSPENPDSESELAQAAMRIMEVGTMVGTAAYASMAELIARRFAATELYKRIDRARKAAERKRARQSAESDSTPNAAA